MSMQLFTFGHPCEHQLRRACIGGSNCPLNGYPDTWCCSFIKGKINFKRDRPCEGLRCHWDFVHPTQSQFDEVTQVLEQSRPIAAKLDEAKDTDLLSFQINNPHITDTVQCALHMMRHPPSTCARRVGQLLAYAAVLAGDQEVFVQLLKTMKKPVDGYILGAYAYLTQSKPGSGAAGGGEKGNANAKGNTNNKKQQKKKDSKEGISATLANIMVELMNAALSLNGQLVDREDQHVLQAMLIKALSTYPKSDKRHQEMLERAIAKFGNRNLADEEEAQARCEAARHEAATAAAVATTPIAKELNNPSQPPGTAATGSTAADDGEVSGAAAAAATEEVPAAPPAPPAAAAAVVTAATAAAPTAGAAEGLATAAVAVTTPTMALAAATTPRDDAATGATLLAATATVTTPRAGFSSAPGTPSTTTAVAATVTGPFNAPLTLSIAANEASSAVPPSQQQQQQTSPLVTADAAAVPPPSPQGAASAVTNATATPATTAATGSPPSSAQAPPPAGPVVGISKILPVLRNHQDRYDKILVWPLPNKTGPVPSFYLCGGQLAVRAPVWGATPLGCATRKPPTDVATVRQQRYKEEAKVRKAAQEEATVAAVARAADSATQRIGENDYDSDSPYYSVPWSYYHHSYESESNSSWLGYEMESSSDSWP